MDLRGGDDSCDFLGFHNRLVRSWTTGEYWCQRWPSRRAMELTTTRPGACAGGQEVRFRSPSCSLLTCATSSNTASSCTCSSARKRVQLLLGRHGLTAFSGLGLLSAPVGPVGWPTSSGKRAVAKLALRTPEFVICSLAALRTDRRPGPHRPRPEAQLTQHRRRHQQAADQDDGHQVTTGHRTLTLHPSGAGRAGERRSDGSTRTLPLSYRHVPATVPSTKKSVRTVESWC